MATALFIDEQYIKDTSYLDENVDVKLIAPIIAEAQDIHIHTLLGTALYNEVSAQIIAGTLTALNTTLVNTYCAKSLKYWVMYEGVDVFNFKFTNKAIIKRTSEHGNAVETSDVKRLMDRLKDKAEWYDKRLVNYLCENSASYPLYLSSGNGVDDIIPNRNVFTTGIYLGNTYKYIDKADLYENPKANNY